MLPSTPGTPGEQENEEEGINKLRRCRKEKVRVKKKRTFGPRLDPLLATLRSEDGIERQ